MISRADLIASAEPTPDRMLAPSAYSEALLPSLRLARSSQFARMIGKTLLLLLIIGFGFVSVAPWQQSVNGSGTVIAPNPEDQPQTIEAPIKGRILRWGKGIKLNATVTDGQLIAEIQDIDPNLLTRIQDQVEASKSQVAASELLVKASERNTEAAKRTVESQRALLKSYELAMEQTIAAAEAAVASSKNKVQAEEKERDEFQAALTQIEADYNRQKKLFEEQIVAEVKLQLAERKLLETKAKIEKATAKIASANNDVIEKQRDRDSKAQKAQAEIDYASAQLEKAIGSVAKAESEEAKARAELQKSRKSLLELETKQARQLSQRVEAPFDGQITYIAPNQGTKILKEGDPLCIIVPQTKERAVEIMLDGNDAPLVEPGRHVRLQFEGWPAVQFAGWPSVAVGTFGGEVISVDATDNGKGKFRVIVRPDDEVNGWPDDRYLRQGVRANGWVLLEQVPLWYEIWRNMNGFPPVVTQDDKGAKDATKKPKLPK